MRVGTIGDPHEPFTHPMYMRFCRDTFEKWRVDRIVCIGDLTDGHAVSFHEHDPDGLSAGDELKLSQRRASAWDRAFKDALACLGNHDLRIWRIAKRFGLPVEALKGYREIFGTPTWKWDFFHEIDGVGYMHGTGCAGKYAAINQAIQRRMSIVMGHLHSDGGVHYHTNPHSRIFGAATGCGIDIKAYAFAYGREMVRRPTLGCVVAVDGEQAHFIPMPCSRGEKYHRSRAGRKRARASR